jgi:hypothetical protein
MRRVRTESGPSIVYEMNVLQLEKQFTLSHFVGRILSSNYPANDPRP